MGTLEHLIAAKWSAEHPDRLQLYSYPTPNGVKVAIALEELELPYEPHLVDIGQGESHDEAFLSLNPNGKIPAIIDPDGPGGQPFGLFESGAILLYLAEKAGRLMPEDPAERWQAVQWIMWQMGGLGPTTGQLGYFLKFAGAEIEDKRPLDHFAQEVRRLLGVLDRHLESRPWVAGADFGMADIALIGWVRAIPGFFEAGDVVGWPGFGHVQRWLDAALERPAVQRGLRIPRVPRD